MAKATNNSSTPRLSAVPKPGPVPSATIETYRNRLFEDDIAFTDLRSAVKAVHALWFDTGLNDKFATHEDVDGFNYALDRLEEELETVSKALWPGGRL